MSAAREPEVIPVVHHPLGVSGWNTPEASVAMGQISTLSIVCNVIVRRIDRSPIRVVFGIIVEELVLVGAVTSASVWRTNQVSTSGLVGTDIGGQHEWAGREKALIRVVKRCLPCRE